MDIDTDAIVAVFTEHFILCMVVIGAIVAAIIYLPTYFVSEQQEPEQSVDISSLPEQLPQLFTVAAGTQPWLEPGEDGVWHYAQPGDIPPFDAFAKPVIWNLTTTADVKNFLRPTVQIEGPTKPILIAAQSSFVHLRDLIELPEDAVGIILDHDAAVLLASCGFQGLNESTYVVFTIANDNNLVAGETDEKGLNAAFIPALRARKLGAVVKIK